ncbi:DUF6366 family protein [Ferdinandcohnia quinoae]|uniref:DUF6366 family protein n=1 Tax=Fredinandcohnia quinoae TaxID=2918902 RepID=A0AAW5EDS4_9BACI|nr:DUF6366 family protein [Fredinandcohnia sp. SECRCQ15]MCH1627880.1 DUF6366 family protein [Fredinandcohnia sp. SECRCQ15]
MENEEEILRGNERKRIPTSNLSDSVNRSMYGEPSAIARGGCLAKIITLLIVVLGVIFLSKCSY